MKKESSLLFANIITIVLLLTACGRGKTSFTTDGGDTLHFRYAHYIQIIKKENHFIAELRNPWDTLRTLHTYVLTPDESLDKSRYPDATIVKIPLQNSLVYSSVHCSLLEQLGRFEAIGGVCDKNYIMLESIHKACDNGTIADAGSSMNPDIEKVVQLRPDAVLLSPFENSGGYGRIEKLGIPIIECADYMEVSPLARAEWMKFFGILYGCEAQADSLFAQVEEEYNLLKRMTDILAMRPKVICDLKMGSAWYVAGGNSTTARFLADAGAAYPFAYTPESGSIPLSFETVFDKGGDADFWLIKYNQAEDMTYASLRSDNPLYAKFAPFREKTIYACNTGKIAFYEEVPFRPELYLKELVKIFHPELLPDYDLRYFRKLADK